MVSACSHSRAHLFFTASIISDRIFGARQCESLAQCTTGEGLNLEEQEDNKMGFYTDVTKKRDVNTMYYLQTNITDLNDVPWCKSHFLLLCFFIFINYLYSRSVKNICHFNKKLIKTCCIKMNVTFSRVGHAKKSIFCLSL